GHRRPEAGGPLRLFDLGRAGSGVAGRAADRGRLSDRIESAGRPPRHSDEMKNLRTQTLRWGVAAAPLPGQTESGDRFLVEPFYDGTLVAVVDALGHGHRASLIAAQAIDTLTRYARSSVTELFLRGHEALRGRYGA